MTAMNAAGAKLLNTSAINAAQSQSSKRACARGQPAKRCAPAPWRLLCPRAAVRVCGVPLPGMVHDGTALVRCACAGVTQVAGPHQICCADQRRFPPVPLACRCIDPALKHTPVKNFFMLFMLFKPAVHAFTALAAMEVIASNAFSNFQTQLAIEVMLTKWRCIVGT